MTSQTAFVTDKKVVEVKNEILLYLKTKELSVSQAISALSEANSEVLNTIKEKQHELFEKTLYK